MLFLTFTPQRGFFFSIHALGVRATELIEAKRVDALIFLSTPFSQKATKIQLLFNRLIAVAGTNVGMNAF